MRTIHDSIQPTKIPTVILFGGPLGGVADGILRAGCFEILVVYEYSQRSAASHRSRYPSIPVCCFELGNDINLFLDSLRQYIPCKDWHRCFIQASPPCRKLSDANKFSFSKADAMRLVYWTLSVVDTVAPAAYVIENVTRMIDYLDDVNLSSRYCNVFDLSYYVPQKRMRAMISSFPLSAIIVPLSSEPIPACDVLPLVPFTTEIMNRYGYRMNIREPSLTIVGHQMFMFDTTTEERSSMDIKTAQVLQGFAYNLDVTAHVTGLKNQRLAIGDAVPPPFMYACGIACALYIRRFVRTHIPTPRHVLSNEPWWPRAYALTDDILHTSSDLSDIVSLCGSDIWKLISCTHGTTDSNKYVYSGDLRLVGECMMFIDGIIDPSSLYQGMRAISTGRCLFISVRNARRANAIPPLMMSVFIRLCKLAPRLAEFNRRIQVFEILGSYTYHDIHNLYRMSEHISDSKVRCRVRSTITKYSKFRFKVHPAPSFGISIPAVFGVRRSILTRILWCILRKMHLPIATKRHIQQEIKISFTANPSCKAILCNSQKLGKKWLSYAPWPCTCAIITRDLNVPVESEHTVSIDGKEHIHTFLHKCDGGFLDVVNMNLNDICEPDIGHLSDTIPDALYVSLRKIKEFVCSLRQRPTDQFHYLYSEGLSSFTIPKNDHLSASILRAISSLGLPIDSECVRHITSLSSAITAFSPSPLCKASRVYQLARKINDNACISYCDKNGGAGSVACLFVNWHTLYTKLWTNKEYEHFPNLTPETLLKQHYSAYIKGGWNKFSSFRLKGTPASMPFVIPKFKDLKKTRPILSSKKLCLTPTYSRVCTALNFLLVILATTSPLYANTLSTFSAAKSTISQWQDITDQYTGGIVAGYAGDISSMFDALPGNIVLKAIAFILEQAADSVIHRYNLRKRIRNFVTIHLSDPTRHGIGITYYGEDVVTISFEQIVEVSTYYIYNTYFSMSNVMILLKLGIPQGGAMSGPLSQMFTIYCEYMWHSSLYDYKAVSRNGMVRLTDLTDLGKRTLFPQGYISRHGDAILMYVMFKRYADDCRTVILHTPKMSDAVARYLVSYKTKCYEKPCMLEDEADTPTLEFLQGIFVFTPHKCIARYQSKNFIHFAEHNRPKFRTMQHYSSYCVSPDSTRYSTIAGKLSEIDAFSSDDTARMLGVLSIVPDLVHLRYPISLVIKALYVRTRRTGDQIWSEMSHTVNKFMKWQYKCYDSSTRV
jgi:site-specific DNA-cytosine methylase